MLLTSVDSDDRVDPMHARKFFAAIDAASTSGRPNLLRIESNSGHGGGDMRKKAVAGFLCCPAANNHPVATKPLALASLRWALAKNPFDLPFAQDDQVIETAAPQRADHALTDRILISPLISDRTA